MALSKKEFEKLLEKLEAFAQVLPTWPSIRKEVVYSQGFTESVTKLKADFNAFYEPTQKIPRDFYRLQERLFQLANSLSEAEMPEKSTFEYSNALLEREKARRSLWKANLNTIKELEKSKKQLQKELAFIQKDYEDFLNENDITLVQEGREASLKEVMGQIKLPSEFQIIKNRYGSDKALSEAALDAVYTLGIFENEMNTLKRIAKGIADISILKNMVSGIHTLPVVMNNSEKTLGEFKHQKTIPLEAFCELLTALENFSKKLPKRQYFETKELKFCTDFREKLEALKQEVGDVSKLVNDNEKFIRLQKQLFELVRSLFDTTMPGKSTKEYSHVLTQYDLMWKSLLEIGLQIIRKKQENINLFKQKIETWELRKEEAQIAHFREAPHEDRAVYEVSKNQYSGTLPLKLKHLADNYSGEENLSKIGVVMLYNVEEMNKQLIELQDKAKNLEDIKALKQMIADFEIPFDETSENAEQKWSKESTSKVEDIIRICRDIIKPWSLALSEPCDREEQIRKISLFKQYILSLNLPEETKTTRNDKDRYTYKDLEHKIDLYLIAKDPEGKIYSYADLKALKQLPENLSITYANGIELSREELILRLNLPRTIIIVDNDENRYCYEDLKDREIGLGTLFIVDERKRRLPYEDLKEWVDSFGITISEVSEKSYSLKALESRMAILMKDLKSLQYACCREDFFENFPEWEQKISQWVVPKDNQVKQKALPSARVTRKRTYAELEVNSVTTLIDASRKIVELSDLDSKDETAILNLKNYIKSLKLQYRLPVTLADKNNYVFDNLKCRIALLNKNIKELQEYCDKADTFNIIELKNKIQALDIPGESIRDRMTTGVDDFRFKMENGMRYCQSFFKPSPKSEETLEPGNESTSEEDVALENMVSSDTELTYDDQGSSTRPRSRSL